MLNVQGSNYAYSGNISYQLLSVQRLGLPKCSLFIVARVAAGAAHVALAAGARLAGLAGGEGGLRFAGHAGGRGLRRGGCLILSVCREAKESERELLHAAYTQYSSVDGLPRCARYLAELRARADTSLSDSEPSVSYSVIGM